MTGTLTAQRPRKGKELRRRRIIAEAQRLIGRDGFDALSLRKLAAAADVTVPTIYNLVGSKEDLLTEIFDQLIDRVEASLNKISEDEPLKMAESIVIEAVRLIEDDEPYYRAAHLAMTHLSLKGDGGEMAALGEKAAQMQVRAVRLAQRKGMLRGDVSAKLLGRHIYKNYSNACNGWLYGECDPTEFRIDALRGVYLHFLTDAADHFRPVLLKRLRSARRRK